MSVYVIGDLHLSLSVDKPMDVFGSRWQNYVQRIENNWKKLVCENDTVIIPGDISWGLSLDDAKADYDFIEKLPGKKIFFKGNHDLYWLTQAKMNTFIKQNGYKTFTFMYNSAMEVENFIICGTRGWYTDEKDSVDELASNKKIMAREIGRLRMSVEKAQNLQNEIYKETGKLKEIIAFLHFPCVLPGYMCEDMIKILSENNIKRCFYGHIHGSYDLPYKITNSDVDFYLVSADYLNFVPKYISEKNT